MCSLQLDVNSVAALQAEVSAMCCSQQARSQKRKALLAHQDKTCFPLWGGGTDAEYCWLWFCWSPAAEMKWETLCSRSKQLLSFTLHSHKELSGLCLWIGITFVLAALKYSVSYVSPHTEILSVPPTHESGGKKKTLWLIYQLYLDCTRINAAIRRCRVLDPSVLKEQRAWRPARSLQVRYPQLAAISVADISAARSQKSSHTAWILLVVGYGYTVLASEMKCDTWSDALDALPQTWGKSHRNLRPSESWQC